MTLRVDPLVLQTLARRLLLAGGVDVAQANAVAGNMVWNDRAGRDNTGVERWPILLERGAPGTSSRPCPLTETRAAPPAGSGTSKGCGTGARTGRRRTSVSSSGRPGQAGYRCRARPGTHIRRGAAQA